MNTSAFIFPGQGSQFVGMGLDFYNNFQVAKDVIDEVDNALNKKLSTIMFEGPVDLLTATENAQPAIMCLSIAILKIIETETNLTIDKMCKYVAGHSLGEYSALCSAKALSLSDTAKLLKVRGESFASAGKKNPGLMIALIGATLEQAEAICQKAKLENQVLQVANDNNTGQIVLSGSVESIDQVPKFIAEFSIKKAVKLQVSGAFHSKLMEPAIENMTNILNETKINSPVVPVITNVSAKPVTDSNEIKNSLLKQIVNRVRWRETVLFFEDNGITNTIEVGSNKILSNMVARTTKNISSVAIYNMESLKDFISNYSLNA